MLRGIARIAVLECRNQQLVACLEKLIPFPFPEPGDDDYTDDYAFDLKTAADTIKACGRPEHIGTEHELEAKEVLRSMLENETMYNLRSALSGLYDAIMENAGGADLLPVDPENDPEHWQAIQKAKQALGIFLAVEP